MIDERGELRRPVGAIEWKWMEQHDRHSFAGLLVREDDLSTSTRRIAHTRSTAAMLARAS